MNEVVPETDYASFREGPWRPQAGSQLEAVRKAWVSEMLYGGARGGGKTAFLLGDFGQDVPTEGGAGWHGILFRRTYGQLEEVIKQSLETYPRWFDPKQRGLVTYLAGEKTWRWKNGATLKLRYAESDDDWMQYHGHQYTWIGFDELTTWPNREIYLRMKATLRSADKRVKYRRIRATANPGGPGHQWVKSYFGIDRYPEGSELLTPDDGSGMTRMFIKSRVQDNKILMQSDPGYVSRLKSLGSPELVRAWLDGDWNVVQGAYFPEFDPHIHVIRPFEVPDEWTKLRGADWGSAKPSAVEWAAVSDGQPVPGSGRIYPKGALIVYRELYTSKGPNVGRMLDANELADLIVLRETERIDDSVMDPAAFAQNGGPSIAERMARHTDGRVLFRRGDNKRIPGWDLVRERLKGGEEGPMIYFFDSCTDIIRTLPAIQHDQTKQEDVDTDGEDHCFAAGTLVECSVGKVPIETMVAGDLQDMWVKTRFGLRHFRNGGSRGIRDVVEMFFSDGSRLVSTPDHRFLTEDGWIAAEQLKGRNIVRSYLPTTPKSLWERGITAAGSTSSGKVRAYTDSSGKSTKGRFLQATTSTTRTLIALITRRRTLGSFLPKSTLATTATSKTKPRCGAGPTLSAIYQWRGTSLRKAGNGTGSTGQLSTYAGRRSRWYARIVRSLTKHGSRWLAALSTVTRTARPLRCVSVEPLPPRETYCITVDSVGEFLLSGGLVVSNSADAIRYLCMARPWTKEGITRKNGDPTGVRLDDLWKEREVTFGRSRKRI